MKDKLKSDLKQAMRNKDTLRRNTVRLLLNAVKNAEIDKGQPLSEQEMAALIQKQAKQRRDAIAAFNSGGRTDLAATEQAELDIILTYLPKQMGEDEILQMVRAEIEKQGASSMKDMGRVMGALMRQLRGKADGSVVQRLVRQELKR